MASRSLMSRTVVVTLLVLTSLVACSKATPSASPIREPTLVTPTAIEMALRAVVPHLALAPCDDRDHLGVFPELSFVDRNAVVGRLPSLGRVLVFPSVAERVAMQSRFGPSSINGDGVVMNWDGPTHSEWISVRNVLVEVIVPGGMFGQLLPWTDPIIFVARIKAALARL